MGLERDDWNDWKFGTMEPALGLNGLNEAKRLNGLNDLNQLRFGKRSG
jgi:hypothetical protein